MSCTQKKKTKNKQIVVKTKRSECYSIIQLVWHIMLTTGNAIVCYINCINNLFACAISRCIRCRPIAVITHTNIIFFLIFFLFHSVHRFALCKHQIHNHYNNYLIDYFLGKWIERCRPQLTIYPKTTDSTIPSNLLHAQANVWIYIKILTMPLTVSTLDNYVSFITNAILFNEWIFWVEIREN